MKITDTLSQNLLIESLDLGTDKASEFKLTEDSFAPVLIDPSTSRLLGEVAHLNGSHVQHFYIAPMTIHPSRTVINHMQYNLPASMRDWINHFQNFRTPPFIVKARTRKDTNRPTYGDFSFFPLMEVNQAVWNHYFKYGRIFNDRGDILLNNTYAGESGNWCFGQLNMSELFSNDQKVNNLYGVHAIESIIINFINASPNHDLGWLHESSKNDLHRIGIQSALEWNNRQAMYGFWLAQYDWATHKNLNLKDNTPELKKSLDEFWSCWITRHRSGTI